MRWQLCRNEAKRDRLFNEIATKATHVVADGMAANVSGSALYDKVGLSYSVINLTSTNNVDG